jgi:hypothetical protein
MRDIRPDFKRCSCCGEIKERDNFSLYKNKKANTVSLRSRCKTCTNEIQEQQRATKEGKASVKAASRKHYEKHPEKCKAAARVQYKKHPERYKAWAKAWAKANPDKVRQCNKAWEEANPERSRALNTAAAARRRAKELRATPEWVSHKDILEIYDQAQNLTVMTGVERHVDHIIPLAGKNVCGLHVAWNLQILTAKENLMKGTLYTSDVSLTDLM